MTSKAESPNTPNGDSDIGPWDFLLGSQGATNSGNIRFRELIANKQVEYMAAGQEEKHTIVLAVVDEIHGKGGRFLKRDDQSGCWAEVPKKKAVAKATQALREGKVTANPTMPTKHRPVDYVCVLDFEAICNRKGPAPKPQEIIEFPTLLVNVATGKVEQTFHHYIRPDVHPTLSEFCTELTGITQETTDAGISLQEALLLHEQWLTENNLVSIRTPLEKKDPRSTFVYLTCGDWDIQSCLQNQLAFHGQKMPQSFKDWINIKVAFGRFYKLKGKAGGMTAMLNHQGMELIGRHHSGIDDCHNIARICSKMLKKGWVPEATASLE